MNIFYLCSGNKCRSRLLSAYTSLFSGDYGLDIETDSAGVDAGDIYRWVNSDLPSGSRQARRVIGEQLDEWGIEGEVLQKVDDIFSQRVKLFDPEEHGQWADLILTATRNQKIMARRMVRNTYPVFSRERRRTLRKIRTVKEYGRLDGDPDILDYINARIVTAKQCEFAVKSVMERVRKES